MYRRLAEKAKDIISVHVMKEGSATSQVAGLAAQSVPEANVTVYDSGSVSMGIGFLALEAAKCAMRGLSKEEILSRLDSLKSRIYAFAAIPTLKYLRKSGGSAGESSPRFTFVHKPILEIKDGVIGVVDQVRTFSKALTRMLELAHEVVGNHPAVVAVMHANAPEAAKRIRKSSQKETQRERTRDRGSGPARGSRRPRLIGIVVYRA